MGTPALEDLGIGLYLVLKICHLSPPLQVLGTHIPFVLYTHTHIHICVCVHIPTSADVLIYKHWGYASLIFS